MPVPCLSVVIPTHARVDLLRAAIASLAAQRNPVEVIVVDNASIGHLGDRMASEYGGLARPVRLEANSFFCSAVNAGIAEASAPFIAVLNDDCTVSEDWSSQILETFECNPSIGSVASLVLAADDRDRIDSAGNHLDLRGLPGSIGWREPRSSIEAGKSVEVFSAAGSCAVYCADALRRVGLFDARFRAYVDDIDVGFRLQLAGYRCVLNPEAVAFHVGGATFKPRSEAVFLTERNLAWNIVKNMPTRLLRRHRRGIVRVQARPAPVVGGSNRSSWARGKSAAVAGLGSILRQRSEVQRSRAVPDDYIEALLDSRTVGECHL